jgi:hypothetical protein
MELMSELFNNPIMQSMVLGPIMGVVVAAIFAGFTERPTRLVPVTVVQTREVYVTRVIERRVRRSNSQEGGGVLVIAGFGLLFVLWKYAIYVNEIHQVIGISLLTALSFSATAIFLSYLKGQFTSEEWWIYLVSPLLLLVGCMYLLNLAHTSFDPEITKLALQNNPWQFYTRSLSEFGRNFMLAHVAGIVVLCLVIVFSCMALLHYLSLMNQRSAGVLAGLWFYIAKATMLFSGKAWLVIAGVLIVLAFIGIEPTAGALWLMKK